MGDRTVSDRTEFWMVETDGGGRLVVLLGRPFGIELERSLAGNALKLNWKSG